MKSKNKIKLRRISLLISLGIILTTQNMGATSYSQTLTGDLETDSDQGYSITETLPGHLVYNFLPTDKIHILGDHSVLPSEPSIEQKYYGVKFESGNNNDLDLTSLKNISIDLLGLSGTAISDSNLDIDLEAVGIRDDGSGQRSFEDDTQINISNTSGNLTVGTESGVEITSSLTGISQEGSNGTSNHSFGDRTQITLSDISGEFTLEAENSSVTRDSNLKGISQDSSTTATKSQTFGDGSQITLSTAVGDSSVGDESSLSWTSNHIGIEQNNNVTSVLNTGVGTGINEKISNNQSFGDNTQIRVNETLGDLTVAAGSNTELNLSQIGIGQSSYLSNFAFGSGTTHTETSNVQEFGDNTEINLNVTTGNQILDGGGDSTIESNLIGIDQRTSYNAYSALDSSGTNQNISNQTFGKGTKILLSSTMGDQNTSINSRTNQSSHLTGVIQESVHSIYGSDASSVENRNDHSQIFGNDTQILLSTTFGNSTNDAPISEYNSSSVNVTSELVGINQNTQENVRGSDDSTTITLVNNSSQVFGNNTKIILSNQSGDIVGDDNIYVDLNPNLSGVAQRTSLNSYAKQGENSLDFSSTQKFGDNTQIYLSNKHGDISVGDDGRVTVHTEFTGISQATGLYKNEYSGNDDYTINSSQVFGDNTRVVIDNTIGTLSSTGEGNLSPSVNATGIYQTNNFGGSSSGYGETNNVTAHNSQIFGNDTQIILTSTLDGFVSGVNGYNDNYVNLIGIEQNGSSSLTSDSLSLTNDQTFGDNTRVILSSMRKEQPASEGGEFSSTENLNGISQSDSGGSQIFGKNTQILLKNRVGNLTIGNGGTGVSSDSSLIGINQTNSKNSTQTFGDNTQISLENTLGGVTTGDSENTIDMRIEAKGIDQGTYKTGNNQIFGNNTQINLNNHVGDLVSGGGESSINLDSQVVGVSQSGSSGNNQIFGENTQIKVESKAGAIKNADFAEIDFSAKGVEQASRGAQMIFGNGTQVTVHAEIGVIEGLQELNSSVNAYGIYSVGSLEDDLVFEGDLSVQATIKPLIRDGVVLVDQANAYSLFATGNGAIRLNDQGTSKITLVGDLGTGVSGMDNRVTVDLSNSTSYFQGTVKANEGSIFLTLAEGATWRPQGDGNIDATFGESGGQLDLKSGGVVDLAWWNNQNSRLNPTNQFRTLTIDHATLEDGGIFRVNSDVLHGQADRINIVDASGGGTQYIQVAYDPSMTGAGGVLGALPGNEPIVLDIQGGTALDQVVGKMYQSDSPLHQYEIDPTIVSDGHQVRIGSLHYTRTENLSETPYTVVDAQAAFRNLWKLEGNNVLRRMGDLRLAPEENTSGAWARVYGGKLTSDSSYQRTFEQKYTGIQGGYDREHLLRNGKLYTGVMFNYLDSSPSYSSGSGSLYSKGLGVYGSWIGNNNHYVDLVLRASRLNNEYHLVDNSGNFASGSYDAWTYGISAEYGYRAPLQNQFFLEPQVELSFGHIGSADHKTDSGLSVQQNSINTAQSRIGLLIGKDFGSKNQKGNAYFRGSWVHDFSSNGTLNGFYQGDRARLKTADHQGSHLELNLGANLKVNQKLDTYLELTKTFGGKVDTDWQINGGIRLMW